MADADLGARPGHHDAAHAGRRSPSPRTARSTWPGWPPPDGAGFVDRLPEPDGLPDWLSQAELDHYSAEFTRTGFTGGINWYRNFDRNWELTPQLDGAKVTVPSLFIGGERRPGRDDDAAGDHGRLAAGPPRQPSSSTGPATGCSRRTPAEVNAALLTFLHELDLGGR